MIIFIVIVGTVLSGRKARGCFMKGKKIIKCQVCKKLAEFKKVFKNGEKAYYCSDHALYQFASIIDGSITELK